MSLTYLVRTEARGTSSSLEPGLAARIADPLWLLGRQWQLGELLGEDAGSPVDADLEAETASIVRFRRDGQTSGVGYDPAALPLDVMTADRIRSASGWTTRLRVDTGRAFVSALRDAGLARYAAAFRGAPIPLAPAERFRWPAVAHTRRARAAARRRPRESPRRGAALRRAGGAAAQRRQRRYRCHARRRSG